MFVYMVCYCIGLNCQLAGVRLSSEKREKSDFGDNGVFDDVSNSPYNVPGGRNILRGDSYEHGSGGERTANGVMEIA